MRLNLGSCDRVIPGHLNVDVAMGPGVDLVADLCERWPWEDSTIVSVIAHDVFEHLPDKIHTMNELHRVLVPGGIADIIVPSALGSGGFQDPTHVSYWVERSFLYFTSGSPYRERFARSYGVTAAFCPAFIHVESTPEDGPRIHTVLHAVK